MIGLENKSQEEVVDYLANKIERKAATLVPDEEVDVAMASMRKFKNLLDGKRVEKKLFSSEVLTRAAMKPAMTNIAEADIIEINSIPSLKSIACSINENQAYTDKEKLYLNKIVDLITLADKGLVSDDNFENRINKIIKDFDGEGFNENSVGALSIASALSIAKYSTEWWKENKDQIIDGPIDSTGPVGIAHIVARDLAGAFVGAAINAGTQAVYNSRWSWRSFGTAVGMGALSASCGWVGKVARLFR